MSKPVVVSIPHRLGREEALRRIKSGFARARGEYAHIITVTEEAWSDNRVVFGVRAVGQAASGALDVADDHVRLEVTLPWLLSKIAEKIVPQIRKEGVLMLEKKS